jgi:hypothetical protein
MMRHLASKVAYNQIFLYKTNWQTFKTTIAPSDHIEINQDFSILLFVHGTLLLVGGAVGHKIRIFLTWPGADLTTNHFFTDFF